MTITIYHNPACGTSRNTLAMIRQSGIEPRIVEYLKTPPARQELERLIRAMGISPRDLLREKGTPYKELGLDDPKWSDEELIGLLLAQSTLRGDGVDGARVGFAGVAMQERHQLVRMEEAEHLTRSLGDDHGIAAIDVIRRERGVVNRVLDTGVSLEVRPYDDRNRRVQLAE